MIFYRFNCKTFSEQTFSDNREKRRLLSDFGEKCDYFSNNEITEKIYFILNNISSNSYVFEAVFSCGIYDYNLIDKSFEKLLEFLKLEFESVEKEEIFSSTFCYDLENLDYFLSSRRKIEENFSLDIRKEIHYEETKIEKDFSLNSALKMAKSLPINDISQEIKRIFAKKKSKNFGVPVHYLIKINDSSVRKQVVELLVGCLHANKRILRNKYTRCFVNTGSCYGCSFSDVNRIYDINEGGAVALNLNICLEDNDKYTREHEIAEKFCNSVKKFANNTTTIICACSSDEGQSKYFENHLDNLSFFEIKEELMCNENAKNFLLDMAKQNRVKNPESLLDKLEADKSYSVEDLSNIYAIWFENYTKTCMYPQYVDFVKHEVKKEEIVVKNGMKELNELIGLSKIKKIVQNYINYQIVQKARDKNEKYNICRHMTFVGNPGTAKTTVARIIARIMREEGLLTEGRLIEVGRSDIVSKYVGGTAPKVKELFDKAKGNVLFIDEAYSLYDGKEGLYGDEAINAIVQEMENKRNNIVVIFAGYKKEMDKFLDRNSGLRSRIAYEVNFEDYDDDELLKIADYTANKMNIDISTCKDTLKEIIQIGKNNKNFGNGRFIRNVLEHALINQANRIVTENKLDTDEINKLLPEDFELPEVEHHLSLGFRE